jgi:hypothetical protein
MGYYGEWPLTHIGMTERNAADECEAGHEFIQCRP